MIWFLLFAGFGSLNSGGPTSAVQSAMDLGHLELRLQIDPEQRRISGEACWQIGFTRTPPDRLEFDLVDSLRVSGAWLEGEQVAFTHRENLLVLRPKKPMSPAGVKVKIQYEGSPYQATRPPWNGGFCWSESADGTAWVGVCCQGEGAKVWFPSKDRLNDKLEGFDLYFTYPSQLVCVSNGSLVGVLSEKSGWKTSHWRSDYPIATYNISLNLGDFELYQELGEHCPIQVYLQRCPQREESEEERDQVARIFLARTAEMVRWFEGTLGDYPFAADKLAVVESSYLGMEHQTAISYGNPIAHEEYFPYQFDEILFHELGHEWFGNRVSATHWGAFWLQEGLTTFLHSLYLEERLGIDAARKYMKEARREIKNQKAIRSAETASATEAYHDDIYTKVAWILRGLRYQLGREAMVELLRAWASDPRWSYKETATEDDFYRTVAKLANKDYRWYFEPYVSRAELPSLFEKRTEERVELSWQNASFELPLEVEICGDAVRRIRLEMKGGFGEFRLAPDESYRIDPDDWVLRAP